MFGGWNSSHGGHTIHEDFIGIDVAKALRATPEDRAIRLSLKTYLASSRIIDAKEELKYLLNCHHLNLSSWCGTSLVMSSFEIGAVE